MMFSQKDGFGIPDSWVLLDTCSTDSVMKSKTMVSNIKQCEANDCLTIFTNGGSQFFDKMGSFKFFPLSVHFNPDSMANILAMKDVASIPGVRITYDSAKERLILVHFNKCIYRFTECKEDLYFYDTKSDKVECTKVPGAINKEHKDKLVETVTPYSFLSTVESNKLYYTRQEIKGAEDTRKQQEQLGWPSTSKFKRIIKYNLINNSPITINDVNRAEIIFGTPKPLLKGTMIRHVPITNKIEKVALPIQIAEIHKEIHIYIDFFFINGYPFLHTKSSKINFLAAQLCTSRAKG